GSAGVVDGVDECIELARPVAIAQQCECKCRPQCRVGVLAAVFAKPRWIRLDIARVVRGAVEGRREQPHQSIAPADELGIDRRHGAGGAFGIAAARYDRPGLSDGINAALFARRRTQGSAVVEVAAPIPLTVPGLALDRLLEVRGMPAPQRRLGGIAARLGPRRELEQCRVEEPAEPDTLPPSARSYSVHAVVPIAGAE